MRLFAFHIMLIPLGKVLIQLFFFQLCANNCVTYWTLTEPSCSSCVNSKTAICGCKQLTQVDSWKWVTWVDVWALYIHGHPRQWVSHRVTTSGTTRVGGAATPVHSQPRSRKNAKWGPEYCAVCVKKIWVNIAVLYQSVSFISLEVPVV